MPAGVEETTDQYEIAAGTYYLETGAESYVPYLFRINYVKKDQRVDVSGVSLNYEDETLSKGNTLQLIADVSPSDATDKTVSWITSDPTVAEVDNNGLVTAVNCGTATITVKTTDKEFTDSCEITVAHTPGTPVAENEIKATCKTAGSYDEVIRCEACGEEISRTKKTVPALGHDWSEPTYTWSKDNSTVTAARTCTRDESHVETETVSTTSEVTKAATCTAKGQTTYTAVFENAAFAKQTKKVSNIPATGHAYENVLVRATMSKDGSITPTCTVCGAKGKETVIRKIQTVALSKTSFVFNGSVQKPAVTVKDSAGKTIASKYYTATYSNKNSKNAGTYQVMVKFKGNYSGSKTLSYKITQAANSITKFTPTAKTYQYSKTKARSFQITATMKSGTKPTYAKASVTPSKGNGYITVSKTGKVTVQKGMPRGTYTLKVKVTAKATQNYKAKTVTKSIKITVK